MDVCFVLLTRAGCRWALRAWRLASSAHVVRSAAPHARARSSPAEQQPAGAGNTASTRTGNSGTASPAHDRESRQSTVGKSSTVGSRGPVRPKAGPAHSGRARKMPWATLDRGWLVASSSLSSPSTNGASQEAKATSAAARVDGAHTGLCLLGYSSPHRVYRGKLAS